jgi:hypothetical protein
VGRPERPLDPYGGPVNAFAAELRKVREEAGSPKYLQMARATGRSRTALSEAAGGDHLATWETVEAFLSACNHDPAAWRPRWEEVRAWLDEQRHPATDPPPEVAVEPSGSPLDVAQHPTPPEGRAPRWRRPLLGSMLALGSVAAVIALVDAVAGGAGAGHVPPRPRPSGPMTVVVQNKVVSGPQGFFEDSTPVYLSARPIPRCSRNGCEVPGTTMWSGAILQVVCQVQGATMTNADLQSLGVDRNPHAVTSSLWYRAKMPTGVAGYISQVYLSAGSRGGLGLPACPPS